jgi:hypothetical protein
MAIKPRNLALNATIGVAVAALIIAGIFASGIRFPTARTGTLLVLLTDAPVKLDELNMSIESFAVHHVEEGWSAIALENPGEVFNLLELQGGVTMELALDEAMLVGTYNKIRLTIADDSATALVVGEDSPRELKVPPGHIDVITRFEIDAGEITTLIVDIEADLFAISANNRLRPVITTSVVGEAPSPPEA